MTITLSFKNKVDRYNRDTIRYYISHSDESSKKHRSWINTGIKIKPKEIDTRSWRVKVSNANQKELNISLEDAKDKISKALTRFETKQFTYQQVVSYLKGEIDYGSVFIC
jgi:hypothetical protein